ncbi:MAG: hypothetical protein QOI20_3284 [Acidimicrobiaceae bacterium]|jgi:hypothetical protein|nr:hypothetical protein [Acidimicrobiaceae bacterium]
MGEAKGREPTPEQETILADRPDHDDAVQLVVIAYKALETCRPLGLIAGRIPWTAIDRWCERHELDDSAASILIDAVCYVDAEDFKKRAKAANAKKGRR